jgi:hypothetical protein
VIMIAIDHIGEDTVKIMTHISTTTTAVSVEIIASVIEIEVVADDNRLVPHHRLVSGDAINPRIIHTTVVAVQVIEAIDLIGEDLDRILLVLMIPTTVVAVQVIEAIDLLGEDLDQYNEAPVAVLREAEKMPHGR